MKYQQVTTFSLILLICTLYGCSIHTSSSSSINNAEFTIVVIPDTQNAVSFKRQKAEGFAIDSSEIFIKQMQYIATQGVQNGGDVVFVASVGDVWEHVSSNMDPAHLARGIDSVSEEDHPLIAPEPTLNFEIPKAIEGYQLISDAGIPFGVAPGNHDYDAWWNAVGATSMELTSSQAGQDASADNIWSHVGGLDNFRSAFGSDTDFFRDKPWYVDDLNGGGSSAQKFSAGGYEFLHIALEMQPGDEVLAWARDVLNDHKGMPTIVTTHDYISHLGERKFAGRMDLAAADPEGNNSAEEFWQKFLSQNDQIFMVLSGHQRGQAIRVDDNENGNKVYQILADYQDRGQAGLDAGQPIQSSGRNAGKPFGIGDGWFREMTFRMSDTAPSIEVKTYSRHYESYSDGLATYSEWYRVWEQPDMTEQGFLAADNYTIQLDDFYKRFGMPSE